ncbi:sigma-E processing peptidase SpoIIGA [Salipaludibacillus sp. HK11]|uniref:sigma-E processing peptidase SpoIIGA n=1 Tax=Salipaludibacillus sp. HK11 TaxID=3394320 RepID=UPI0039FC9A7A
MTIYLDIIWLLNFCVDLLLLMLTSFVLKKRTTKLRFFLGALFASMYIVFLFYPQVAFMTHPIMKGIYSVFILLITFRFQQFRSFVQALLMFYFVNFAVGGGLIGLHFFLQVDHSFIQGTFATRGNQFGSPISWLFVIVGFPFMFFYAKKRFDSVEAVTIRYEETMDVSIQIDDQVYDLKGFVDSGNQLTDPFSKKPVMIIDMTKVSNEFPKELFLLSMAKPNDFQQIPEKFAGKISLVPYRTIGSNQQFIWTVRPDKVTVYEGENAFDCSKTLVGLSNKSLGENGEYDCLLHPTMMQKRKQA